MRQTEKRLKLCFYEKYYTKNNILCFQAFKKDFDKFKEKIEYLDLRLASIINQAFDDCGSLEAILKVQYYKSKNKRII